MSRRVWGAASVGVSALAASAIVASPASANWASSGSENLGGGWTGEVSIANNKWHSYSMFGPDTATINTWKPAFEDTVLWSYQPTELVVTRYANGSHNVDARVMVFDHGISGFQGWVNCPADGVRAGTDPTESCWKQHLKINTGEVSGMDANQRKSLACHEFGHTVGLRHSDEIGNPGATWHPAQGSLDSCIWSGDTSSPPGIRAIALHAHDIAHLNDEYG